MVNRFFRPRYIFLLAFILRFVGIGLEPLWYDESFTAWIAKLPTLSAVMAAVRADVHPPTWHIVSWLTARVFGASEWALRLPAALFGVAAVYLLWRIALALKFEPRTANLVALLAAINPMAIYYSQEARVYSFLVCAVLLAVLGAIARRWSVLFAGLLATAYSHNLGLFYCVAIGGAVALCELRSVKNLLRLGAVTVGVGVGWLPFASTMISQARSMSNGFWIPPLNLGGALEPLVTMTIGSRPDNSILPIMWLVALVASGVGLVASRRWLVSRSGLIVLATLFGMPALVVVASLIWRSVYLPRAMLPGAFLLMLFWAYALNHLSAPNRATLRRALVPVLLVALLAHYRTAKGRLSWNEISDPIINNWQPGDVIYFSSIPPAMVLGYYIPETAYIWGNASDLNQFLSEPEKRDMQFNIADFSSVAATHNRVWYVRALNFGSSADEIAFGERIERCGTPIATMDRPAWELHLTLVDHECN